MYNGGQLTRALAPSLANASETAHTSFNSHSHSASPSRIPSTISFPLTVVIHPLCTEALTLNARLTTSTRTSRSGCRSVFRSTPVSAALAGSSGSMRRSGKRKSRGHWSKDITASEVPSGVTTMNTPCTRMSAASETCTIYGSRMARRQTSRCGKMKAAGESATGVFAFWLSVSTTP